MTTKQKFTVRLPISIEERSRRNTRFQRDILMNIEAESIDNAFDQVGVALQALLERSK